MIIAIIPPDKIIYHLKRVKQLLEKVEHLLHPRGRASDLIADCISGQLSLWGVFDPELMEAGEEPLLAVLVTYKRDYWRCSVLELIALSGEEGSMRRWIRELNDITERYAQALGCVTREIPGGREPWARYLGRFGFKESGLVTLECPVGQEGRRQ